MKYDPTIAYYNIKTREFAIQNEFTGKYCAVGYPLFYCVKIRPCKTGLRINMGCSGGQFTKEQWSLCPGRVVWHDSERELNEEETQQMFNQENDWIIIKSKFQGENEDDET